MIDLALDKITHDLYIPVDDLTLVDDVDQLEQNLKIKLQFFKDEWFLDTTVGLPFYTDILVKNPNVPNIDSIIKAAIVDTDGVEELLEYNSDYSSAERSFTVSFKVRESFGGTALSVSLF